MNLKGLNAKDINIKNMTAEQKMIALGVIFIVAAITVFVINSTGLRSKLRPGGGKEVPVVVMYYSEDRVHVPAVIDKAIGASSYMEFQVREAISKLHELDKAKKLDEQEREGAKALSNIINGLTAFSNFDALSTHYYQYKIVNEGNVTVEDLEFSLPGSGYVEIHKKGHEVVGGLYSARSSYRYNRLRPGEIATVDYWTNSSLSGPDQITGHYKNGVAKVKPMSSLSGTVEPEQKKHN